MHSISAILNLIKIAVLETAITMSIPILFLISLLLAELYWLWAEYLVSLLFQDRKTCRDQDHLLVGVDRELDLVSQVIVPNIDARLHWFWMLQKQVPLPLHVYQADPVNISDHILPWPRRLSLMQTAKLHS